MAKLQFLGHAACYIEGTGLRALVDPFLSGNPSATVGPEDFQQINYIFVTHGHDDHIGDTVEIAGNNGATVVANADLCRIFQRKGLKTHPMHIGGTFRFPFGMVKMTPALHGSDVQEGDDLLPGGNPGGFLIEVDSRKIYHAGDTGLTMDMQLLRQENIDIALLPSGGNFTMDMADAARAVEMIRPSIAIPVHYNTFDLIKADPEEFVAKASKYAEIRIMNAGDILNF